MNAGKIDAVIVAKLDRLTRSVKDLCGLLELFEKRKVSLISVAESLDTGSAAGRLVITIMGAVSQWEREAIGERTRDALRHKRNKGERVGNIAFGSRLAEDGQHLEPNPIELEAMAEIRRLRGQGATLRESRRASTIGSCGRGEERPGGLSPWPGSSSNSLSKDLDLHPLGIPHSNPLRPLRDILPGAMSQLTFLILDVRDSPPEEWLRFGW